MARFTVADCLERIDNRFDLTITAALRARQIEKGSPILLKHDEDDKPLVIALREIADGKIDSSILNTIE